MELSKTVNSPGVLATICRHNPHGPKRGQPECSTRAGQMNARRREITTALTTLGARRERVLTEWTARLTQAHLPALDAEALREWQRRREVVLALAGRLAGLRSD